MREPITSDLTTINVVGTSGSGKSTFSRKLAEILRLRYIEMDALFWRPNWEPAQDEEFFAKLADEISGEGWVLDGNYSRSVPLKWPKTRVVVWLDYSFSRTLYRAIKRALSRCISQQELWPGTGNRESIGRLFTRESIVLWTITSFHKTRRNYETLMADTQYSHIKFVRLRKPKEAENFLLWVTQGVENRGSK